MLPSMALLVLCCRLPVAQESNVVENVDRLSRLRWSHSHHNQPSTELTLSFQSKLDAVDNRLHVMETRFVTLYIYIYLLRLRPVNKTKSSAKAEGLSNVLCQLISC